MNIFTKYNILHIATLMAVTLGCAFLPACGKPYRSDISGKYFYESSRAGSKPAILIINGKFNYFVCYKSCKSGEYDLEMVDGDAKKINFRGDAMASYWRSIGGQANKDQTIEGAIEKTPNIVTIDIEHDGEAYFKQRPN